MPHSTLNASNICYVTLQGELKMMWNITQHWSILLTSRISYEYCGNFNSITSPIILTSKSRRTANTYTLWLQKPGMLDLSNHLINHKCYEGVIIRAYLAVIFLSYVAVQISTIVEWRQNSLYRQVIPSTGMC